MINILVTLNSKYLLPLKVMLNSLFKNNPVDFSIHLMFSDITDEEIFDLQAFIEHRGQKLLPMRVDSEIFSDAPVFRHFSKEMYYRLGAHKLLPEQLDRILYLDPDIIVLNAISNFYWSDFEDCLFVASEHAYTVKFTRAINRLRLGTPHAKGYFNSGVLLMNLDLIRQRVRIEEIAAFIKFNKHKLLLPDQDILNALYWDKIKPADSFRYNYDARHFGLFKLMLHKKMDLDWIKRNTVFIHFCGKVKPWHKNYKGRLGVFYRQFESTI
jgi:lipopolysaccharide biosynthesis glycosyltransferase